MSCNSARNTNHCFDFGKVRFKLIISDRPVGSISAFYGSEFRKQPKIFGFNAVKEAAPKVKSIEKCFTIGGGDVPSGFNPFDELYSEDGSDEDTNRAFSDSRELARYLGGLSTYGRFQRFQRDYLADMRASGRRDAGTKIEYIEKEIDGKRYFVVRLKDAIEFMTKKDYTANWMEELN